MNHIKLCETNNPKNRSTINFRTAQRIRSFICLTAQKTFSQTKKKFNLESHRIATSENEQKETTNIILLQKRK